MWPVFLNLSFFSRHIPQYLLTSLSQKSFARQLFQARAILFPLTRKKFIVDSQIHPYLTGTITLLIHFYVWIHKSAAPSPSRDWTFLWPVVITIMNRSLEPIRWCLCLLPKRFKGCFRPDDEEDATVIWVNLIVELWPLWTLTFSIPHQDLGRSVVANVLRHQIDICVCIHSPFVHRNRYPF
jgi:hypothetical protein